MAGTNRLRLARNRGGLALCRRGGLYLDLARLGLFRLRERQPQQAVLEVGGGGIRLDATWQGEGAVERAAADLSIRIAALVTLLLILGRAADGERVAKHGDIHVVRLDARQSRLYDQRIRRGVHV